MIGKVNNKKYQTSNEDKRFMNISFEQAFFWYGRRFSLGNLFLLTIIDKDCSWDSVPSSFWMEGVGIHFYLSVC
jgi:hypothetical protein